MIAGVFHEGSGLGNQLHRYVATRVLAEDKGYEWAMMNAHLFKGKDFMNIDISSGPQPVIPKFAPWHEKNVEEAGIGIRSYDPEFNFIEDNTVIDGEFQDERYFQHRLKDVDKWLAVEPREVPEDTCVIGFRGGEYSVFPELFLGYDYWETAIRMMRDRGINKFEVHTDDPELAVKCLEGFIPGVVATHDIGVNWRSVRYAKWLIIANSSFYILPALLGEAKEVIAPRYWARRKNKVWSMPQNYYKRFTYI